jgi:hypothetical protein
MPSGRACSSIGVPFDDRKLLIAASDGKPTHRVLTDRPTNLTSELLQTPCPSPFCYAILYHFFAAALIFAHRALCVAAILLRRAADIFFRGLLFAAGTVAAALSARILAHRAFVAAIILALPAADMWRFGRTVDSGTDFVLGVLDTLPSLSNARTCCNRSISALTSLTMLSLLNVFPVSQMRLERIARRIVFFGAPQEVRGSHFREET